MALSSSLALALVLSAKTSAASRAIDKFSNKTERRLASLAERGSRAMASGLVDIEVGKNIGRGLLTPIKSFARLEDSATDLKVAMMDAAGKVPPAFKKMSDLALQLGNKLPGSTADMNELFTTMLNNGAKAEDVINGTGKAAAYLAVGMKMPFAEAGQMAQRLQIATGVANKDMIKFMDTISRTKMLGVSAADLQFAFSKSAGTLKLLKLQGIDASRAVSKLYAALNRAGMSGETIGTSMSKVFNTFLDPGKMNAFNKAASSLGLNFKFTDKKGNFLGVENMMKQLDKLKNLTPNQRAFLEGKLFASGQAKNAFDILVGTGSAGFNKISQAMAKQASLNQKVNAQLSTLTNLWDAFTGTLDNTLALIGEKYGKQIKDFVKQLTSMAETIGKFAMKHSTIAKWIALIMGGFASLTLVTGALKVVIGGGIANIYTFYKTFKKIAGPVRGATKALKQYRLALAMSRESKKFAGQATMFQKVGTGIKSFSKIAKSGLISAFKGIGRAFSVLGKLLAANWVILAIVAIALAAYFIIKNWSSIKKFFIKLWAGIKRIFSSVWQWIKRMFLNYTPYGLIIKNWSKISSFFIGLWNNVKSYFVAAWDWIKNIFLKYSLPGMIISHWSQIGKFFSTLWDGIKNSFSKAIDWIVKKFNWVNDHILKPIGHFIGFGGGDSSVNISSGNTPLPQPVPVRNNSVNAPFTMNFALSGSATQADANMIVNTVKKHMPGLMKDYNHNVSRINFGY